MNNKVETSASMEILNKTAEAWCKSHGVEIERLKSKWHEIRLFLMKYRPYEYSEENALRAAVRYIVSEYHDKCRTKSERKVMTYKTQCGGLDRTITYVAYKPITK